MDSVEERFLRLVDKNAANGCWAWLGSITNYGYGTFRGRKDRIRAHKWSYLHYIGPIPNGLVLDHLCRNRACVNPRHLEPVTNKENILRGEGLAAVNAKKTHCVRGHKFTEENTSVYGNKRHCRACDKLKYELSRSEPMSMAKSVSVLCDKCGEKKYQGAIGEKARSVRASAKAESWKLGKSRDFCPRCAEQIKAAIAKARSGAIE